jgi:hypothetical protein
VLEAPEKKEDPVMAMYEFFYLFKWKKNNIAF